MTTTVQVNEGGRTVVIGGSSALAAAHAAAAAASATTAAGHVASAQVAENASELAAAQAQAVVGSLERFYPTRAAGAAALATGEWFTSAEEGFLAWYERTGTAPNYAFRDLVYQVPVLRPALSVLPFAMHAAVLAGTSTADASTYLNAALADGLTLQLPVGGARLAIEDTLLGHSHGGLEGTWGCTIWAAPDLGDIPLFDNATGAPANNAARDVNITCRGVIFDGNKANNSTGTEFSHAVRLRAVAAAQVDLAAKDCKGDGFSVQQASGFPAIGSSHITGNARSKDCARNGTAIVSGEAIFLNCNDEGAGLFGLDVEPDDPLNFARNIQIKSISKGSGNGVSQSTGAVCVGDGGAGAEVTGVIVEMVADEANGDGLTFRGCVDCEVRGKIMHPTRNGVKGDGGGVPSSMTFGLVVREPGASGAVLRETAGSKYSGFIEVYDAVGNGGQIELAGGGNLRFLAEGSGDEGLVLDGVTDMTFPEPKITGSAGANVRLKGATHGTRFLFPKLADSGIAQNVIEVTLTPEDVENELGVSVGTPDDNKFLSGRYDGATTFLGADSLATSEPGASGGGDETVETFLVSAKDLTPETTGGASAGTFTGAVNGLTMPVFDFDDTTSEAVNFVIPMPKRWNGGLIQMQALWTAGATGDVPWGFQATAISDGDPLDAPPGSGSSLVIDSVTAAGDLMQTAYCPAFAVNGSPTPEDLVAFRAYRRADIDEDTLTGDARLVGLRVRYTALGDDS